MIASTPPSFAIAAACTFIVSASCSLLDVCDAVVFAVAAAVADAACCFC